MPKQKPARLKPPSWPWSTTAIWALNYDPRPAMRAVPPSPPAGQVPRVRPDALFLVLAAVLAVQGLPPHEVGAGGEAEGIGAHQIFPLTNPTDRLSSNASARRSIRPGRTPGDW